ncbi:hypothetical protein [Streptomyces sp. NPDC005784]|uniref:hypothetical protein n=1 Tax=Streptomyces sp. NPDC005784 TaxID=3364731 RepID=UPI003676B95F
MQPLGALAGQSGPDAVGVDAFREESLDLASEVSQDAGGRALGTRGDVFTDEDID